MMTPETALIIAHLDKYRAHHPTELLAINAAACAHVEGAAAMNYDSRWTGLVKPVQLELASRQLRAHCKAGKPVRATHATPTAPSPSASAPKRTQLDVRGFQGVNKTIKTMAFIRSQPGGASLSHESLHQKACELGQTHEVIS